MRAQKQAGVPIDADSESGCRRALAEALEGRRMMSVTTASIGGSIAAYDGMPAIAYVSATTNHDSPGPAPTYWSVSWGDGATTTATVNGTGSLSHPYFASGNYSITAQVTDDISDSPINYTYAFQSATITDPSLSVTGLNISYTNDGSGGGQFGNEIATFTDSDIGVDINNLSASIAWGDGTSSDGIVEPTTIAGTFAVYGDHEYSGSGGYTATVTCADASAPTASRAAPATQKQQGVVIDGSTSVSIDHNNTTAGIDVYAYKYVSGSKTTPDMTVTVRQTNTNTNHSDGITATIDNTRPPNKATITIKAGSNATKGDKFDITIKSPSDPDNYKIVHVTVT